MNDLADTIRVPADAEQALRMRADWDRFFSQPVMHENLSLTSFEIGQFRHVLSGHGRRAVDIGCGWGFLTAAMAQMGLWTTGYDWSPVAVAGASNLFDHKRLEFKVHDFVTETPPRELVPGSLDVVACRLTLPYLDRHIAMGDFRRWLKPHTGTLYLVVQVWERQQPGMIRGYPNAVVEDLRQGWAHTARWDLDPAGEYTALALTGPGSQ